MARVAELADALDLGSSPRERLGVQFPSLAPEWRLLGFILLGVESCERNGIGSKSGND